MAPDKNPLAERRENASCKPNVRTADSVASIRSATNFRRKPPRASTGSRCSTSFAFRALRKRPRPGRPMPPPAPRCCSAACRHRAVRAAARKPRLQRLRRVSNAAGRCEFRQSCVGALNGELARFEHLCNAYRPHQALGQRTPMQAYNENFSQSALAA